MSSRAILVNFHMYTPYGQQYYEPILDFFLASMKKYQDEYDHLYILEDNWTITPSKLEGLKKVTLVKSDPAMRYYDCYKAFLPEVEEDLVLFLDNDMVIYKQGKIKGAFDKLLERACVHGIGDSICKDCWDGGLRSQELYGVVSIFDTIGDYQPTDKWSKFFMNGKNKFCPYWFAARKNTLMKYLDIDWAPDMPYCETLGHLTEAMLKDELRPYEFEEDKSNILFDGMQDGKKSKDLGYYHCRAGSTVSYLLAEKQYGNPKTYWDYLKNQPISELLRHCAWYIVMRGDPSTIVYDLSIPQEEFDNYVKDFRKYHGLT